jgi:hypothetical protein
MLRTGDGTRRNSTTTGDSRAAHAGRGQRSADSETRQCVPVGTQIALKRGRHIQFGECSLGAKQGQPMGCLPEVLHQLHVFRGKLSTRSDKFWFVGFQGLYLFVAFRVMGQCTVHQSWPGIEGTTPRSTLHVVYGGYRVGADSVASDHIRSITFNFPLYSFCILHIRPLGLESTKLLHSHMPLVTLLHSFLTYVVTKNAMYVLAKILAKKRPLD